MAKLGKAFDWANIATSVWPYFVLVFGATAVTAAVAFVQQNLAWAIFLAAGVFCFGTFGVFIFREYTRVQNPANKLILSSVEFSQRGKASEEHAWYRPSIAFRNLAPYELYFEVLEFECRFKAGVSALDKTERINGIVPQNDTGSISFPAIEGAPLDMLEGRLMVKAKFGRNRDRLSEVLETTVRVSCLTGANLEFFGPVETLRNTLRLEHQTSA